MIPIWHYLVCYWFGKQHYESFVTFIVATKTMTKATSVTSLPYFTNIELILNSSYSLALFWSCSSSSPVPSRPAKATTSRRVPRGLRSPRWSRRRNCPVGRWASHGWTVSSKKKIGRMSSTRFQRWPQKYVGSDRKSWKHVGLQQQKAGWRHEKRQNSPTELGIYSPGLRIVQTWGMGSIPWGHISKCRA